MDNDPHGKFRRMTISRMTRTGAALLGAVVLSMFAAPALATPVVAPPTIGEATRAAFVDAAAEKYALAPARIEAMLAQATYQQGVIDAMRRPAEAKPWKDYRPIFVTPKRIADGRSFIQTYREPLDRVAAQTGVPVEIIAAIIGVETSYGGNTGSYRVLDALYTLAFWYPRSGDPTKAQREAERSKFFQDELAQALVLADEEALELTALRGSYAGAMGYGQFMPSSYRAYARDGSGDGKRDLFSNLPDVFASVANYFVAHGWRSGEPVVVRATRAADAGEFRPEGYEPIFSLHEIASHGYRPVTAVGAPLPATLLTLDGAAGPEYWIAFKNFHVITRYNRSPLYAMSVLQLAQAIAPDAATATDGAVAPVVDAAPPPVTDTPAATTPVAAPTPTP